MATLLDTVRWQFRVGWSLATDIHLPRLTDELCLWMPHPTASTVRRRDDGTWIADWTEPEPGQSWHSTVAWLTWHLQWWLTSALAEVRHESVPDHEAIRWPGSADGTRTELDRLRTRGKTCSSTPTAESRPPDALSLVRSSSASSTTRLGES